MTLVHKGRCIDVGNVPELTVDALGGFGKLYYIPFRRDSHSVHFSAIVSLAAFSDYVERWRRCSEQRSNDGLRESYN